MPAPHPPEFRRRAVELAREVDEDGVRKHPIGQLARDLKISESCLRNWMAAEELETGERSYNQQHRHSTLGMLPPVPYAQAPQTMPAA